MGVTMDMRFDDPARADLAARAVAGRRRRLPSEVLRDVGVAVVSAGGRALLGLWGAAVGWRGVLAYVWAGVAVSVAVAGLAGPWWGLGVSAPMVLLVDLALGDRGQGLDDGGGHDDELG